ncbi:MAG: glycosyltransferase family 39 protein [Gemmatimonadales bacterium]
MTDAAPSRTDAILRGAVAGGVAAVVGIEAISAVGALGTGSAAAVGLAAIGVTGRFLWRAKSWPRPRELAGAASWIVAVVALVTLAVALAAAPNTWDSMTYHLPRVEQWLARGSVAHFPTAVDRQVWQPPFAEFLVTLSVALAGGDRLVNLVQWAAALGAAVAAARITRLLGGGVPATWTAMALVGTAPAVVLQATSTQNDLVAALWVAATAAFALAAWGGPVAAALPGWLGASLGLGIGTKGTALVFGLPWLLVMALGVRRHRSGPAALRAVVVAAGVAGLLNAPWMVRNFSTYGSPLGDVEVQRLLRPPSAGPTVVVANLIANASLNWGTPNETVNGVTTGGLALAHAALGVDPKAAYPYFGGLRIIPWSTDEDLAGSPLLFLLGLVALGTLVRGWRVAEPALRWYLVASLGSLLLFAALVRWQPFGARLQLPGLVLAVPLVAAAAHRWGDRWVRLILVLAGVIAVPPLIANLTRPLIGDGSVFSTPRPAQYFARRPEELAHYRGLIDRLRAERCLRVAVKAGYDSWEYPLWALGRSGGGAIGFEQVLVENATGRLATNPAAPCALVAIDQPADWVPNGPFGAWRAAGRAGRLGLWLPGPAAQ